GQRQRGRRPHLDAGDTPRTHRRTQRHARGPSGATTRCTFEADRKWASVSAGGGHISMRETHPARIAELNDTREVRLE
ncbi:hypothetical protein C7E18_23665, partial [Stenotrophomonas maltophilia]